MAGREAAKEWIRRLQLSRRDLSPITASCVCGEVYNVRKGARGGDHKREGSNGHDVRLIDAVQQVGAEFGVPDRIIRRDGWLVEWVARIVDNCGSEARRALLSPDHKVMRNGLVRLVKIDAKAQEEALRYLIEKGKLPRKRSGKAKVVLPRKKEDLVAALIRLLGVLEAERFHKLFARRLNTVKEQPNANVNQGERKCSADGEG